VIEAGNGRDALELFQAHEAEVDVVLLDMTLPEIPGREVFDALRRKRPDIKVILTTAYAEDMALMAIGGERSFEFMRKPYHLEEMVGLVRKVCLAQSPVNPSAETDTGLTKSSNSGRVRLRRPRHS
jgi:two-component system, cell cycle sensor histidine kinase and response regulator CckA